MTENDTTEEDHSSVSDPTDVKFVGPATAAIIAEASFDASAIPARAVSCAMLTDAGVNPGVAARLRREHSLAWSFEGSDGEDLADRSDQIRGLRDEEREWVAASSGDWENAEVSTSDDGDDEEEWVAASTGDWGDAGAATTDGSGDARQAEAAWRERSKPDPVTDVPGVDEADAGELAEAGITSVRSLAVADPERVADSLTLDRDTVTEWRDGARELQ